MCLIGNNSLVRDKLSANVIARINLFKVNSHIHSTLSHAPFAPYMDMQWKLVGHCVHCWCQGWAGVSAYSQKPRRTLFLEVWWPVDLYISRQNELSSINMDAEITYNTRTVEKQTPSSLFLLDLLHECEQVCQGPASRRSTTTCCHRTSSKA